MFNLFKPVRPFIDYHMRAHQLVGQKLYLYEFRGGKPNGYFIRQEVAHDLTLRGLPMTSFVGVRGLMFIDERGAGIVMGHDWQLVDHTVRLQVLAELSEENARRALAAEGAAL
ncbi:hypothetical protein [Synechococcus phage S-N03]|uniref:Uncharacterized protein n=1 Tax=Synechococcus phage S-N03 TaxID=2718943 RepID=A0A6G8R5M5_9CAUD|nr:hypothetical protein PQC09_gp047 [Synechococcus phage S-N03]QIN96682.1 hypothetical protein [Synechococcus phage S-N03]